MKECLWRQPIWKRIFKDFEICHDALGGPFMSISNKAASLLPTRRSLINRLRNCEDQDSWRDFFKTYWKLIYSFAIRCGCTDAEAEEVVQETVISLSRKMPEYRYDPAICSFKGWLLHVTNWRVIDQLRKRRPGKEMPLSLDAS